MILETPIRNEMRRRICQVANVVDSSAFQFENMPAPEGKSLWIRETWIGGDETPSGNTSTEQLAIVEYDIFVPAGSSAEAARLAKQKIKNEFSLLDSSKFAIAPVGWSGWDIRAYKMGDGTPQTENEKYWVPLLIYLRIRAATIQYTEPTP